MNLVAYIPKKYELLPLISKNADKLVKQTTTKPRETSHFETTKSSGLLSFDIHW